MLLLHVLGLYRKQKEGDYDVVTGTRYASGGGVRQTSFIISCYCGDQLYSEFISGSTVHGALKCGHTRVS
jgi:hypothetical protein